MSAAVIELSRPRDPLPHSCPWLPEPTAGAGWPLLATPVPAGFPSPADDRVERRFSLDEHLIRNAAATFLVRVQGDSMAAAGIRDGDLLVMDRAVPPTEGSVVVAVMDGAFALKQMNRDANGRLAPEPFGESSSPDATPEIWGVARWVIHRIWPGRHLAS
jgi:DNA polymerase V